MKVSDADLGDGDGVRRCPLSAQPKDENGGKQQKERNPGQPEQPSAFSAPIQPGRLGPFWN